MAEPTTAEIQARHDALIKWSVFEGYTNEALVALVKTLHQHRGILLAENKRLIEQVDVTDPKRICFKIAKDTVDEKRLELVRTEVIRWLGIMVRNEKNIYKIDE